MFARPALTALALSLLTACATTPPLDVTRFSRSPDIARAPIVAAPGGPATLEQRSYDDLVARALNRVGFAPGGADARYTYVVEVTRDDRGRVQQRRSPISIGIGGGTGGYGGGLGLGVGFNLGGGGSQRDTVVTRLAVRINDRATGQAVWEGRAEGATGDLDRLAAALFRDFPGASGRTISVP